MDGYSHNQMSSILIAVTNDDGIKSPGIRAAVEAVLGLGELVVIAPSSQQTSMGRSLSAKKDDYLKMAEFEVNGEKIRAYHADSTPAFVVMHAFHTIFHDKRPDLLISGINYGENLGSNLTISGTVGAAIQAATMGVPAIALSLQTDMAHHHHYGDVCWKMARHFVRRVIKSVIESSFPKGVDVLNVNIPEGITEQTECRVTCQSRHPYFTTRITEPKHDSRFGDGKCVVDLDHDGLEKDSDIYAIAKDKVVSVTPLRLDMTAKDGHNKVVMVKV